MSANRFGQENIEKLIQNFTPLNTVKTKKSIWNQFEQFCNFRNYKLESDTTIQEIAEILEDWGANMKKSNGEDYKEYSLKTIWNVTAKQIQEKYYSEYKISFNPFQDIEFKKGRDVRNAKRKELQRCVDKRKQSAAALEEEEYTRIIDSCDEKTPLGLQMKFFHISSYELAWRGGEGVNCLLHYFRKEINNAGEETGRLEYNPIFSKTCQGGNKKCTDTKWLTPNIENPDRCPIRLYNELILQRGQNITTDRLFLTPNPFWTKPNAAWYKNSPVGQNEIGKWLKKSAEKCGLDTKKRKLSNHSSRSTLVSHMVKKGFQEQEAIKITGHATASSLKPYLQIDAEHHKNILEKLRTNTSASCIASTSTAACSTSSNVISTNEETSSVSAARSIYKNCVFNNCTFSNN